MTPDPDWRLPWEGGCRCGALRFRVAAAPLLSTACHCRGCQRMTGGAFSMTLMVPADGFEIIAGEHARCGLGAAIEAGREAPSEDFAMPPEALDHRECPLCGSWVFTRFAHRPAVNLRTTMLDDPSWAAPYVESNLAEALPFVSAGAPHRFDRFPSRERSAELLEGYAREGARPGRPMRVA